MARPCYRRLDSRTVDSSRSLKRAAVISRYVYGISRQLTPRWDPSDYPQSISTNRLHHALASRNGAGRGLAKILSRSKIDSGCSNFKTEGVIRLSAWGGVTMNVTMLLQKGVQMRSIKLYSEKPSFWQLVFSQSKANGADYYGEELPGYTWNWPKNTYLQRRLRRKGH
jgi:hypothetical protein